MFFARIVAPVALKEWLVYTSDNLHFLLKVVMKVPSILFPVARCNTNCHQNHRTMAAISYTTIPPMGQGRHAIARGNNIIALSSTERSNIVSTTGRQDLYLQTYINC
jgi:hypothetical protein